MQYFHLKKMENRSFQHVTFYIAWIDFLQIFCHGQNLTWKIYSNKQILTIKEIWADQLIAHTRLHDCFKVVRDLSRIFPFLKKNSLLCWHVLESIESFDNTIFIHIFNSTTKHEIIQIKNHNLLCSLDPPNQSRLF